MRSRIGCGEKRTMLKWVVSISFFLALPHLFMAQEALEGPKIPKKFRLDFITAARLRTRLMSQSVPAAPRYKTGANVLENLVAQLPGEQAPTSEWQIRFVEDGQFNAYSSPDGVIYVESGLAKLAGSSAGLWAAILSHELAHVMHRDWARRYLFKQELGLKTGSAIILGDPVAVSASWSDSDAASSEMARFCRQLELEADREALMLMAHAGYHPDFAPSLHHMLNAIGGEGTKKSTLTMHPYPEDRDRT